MESFFKNISPYIEFITGSFAGEKRSGLVLWILSGGVILISAFAASEFNRETFYWQKLVFYIFLWSLSALMIRKKLCRTDCDINKILFIFFMISVFFLFRPYLLSDDIERYVWEGYVQNLGHSPYVTPPNDSVFDGEILNKRVNHPQMTAIYPPLIQILFRILAFIYPSLYFFKIFFFIISMFFILYLWKNRNDFEDAFILSGIFPFLAVETAWSGHLEVLPIFFLTVSYISIKKRNYFFSGLFLGFSAMSKLLPALLLIYFLKEIFVFHENKQNFNSFLKSMIIFISGFMLTFLLYIPYLWVGGYLISSLVIYSSQWVFSSFLYSILIQTGMEPFTIRIVSGAALALTGFIIFFQGKDLKTNIFYFMTALCLFSPVVHPWYLLWLIPFAGKKYFYTAFSFLSASFLMYAALEDLFLYGTWKGNDAPVLSAYLSAIAVFSLEHFIRKLHRSDSAIP